MSPTVIARRMRGTPHRLSSEVWTLITNLLVPQGDGQALDEFRRAAGVGAYLVENEALKSSPLVVWGAGPRVRVYCLYDDDAISGDDANETVLPESPTDGDWHMSLPADDSDIDWIRSDLSEKGATRITVRSSSESISAEGNESTGSNQSLCLNEEVFRQL